MEYKIEKQSRGMRIIVDGERDALLFKMTKLLAQEEFNRIWLPSIEPLDIYTNQAGGEIEGQMYTFKDKREREICLRPEATATIRLLAQEHFRTQKNVKFYYFEKCFRYEKPQRGRYREFYQLGVEILNDSPNALMYLLDLASQLVALKTVEFHLTTGVLRGLSYYTSDGFEITCPKLGAEQQVVGGGRYPEGIGFAIGFDRLMLV